MQIYHYDGITKEYLDESTARLDPLAGLPLISANATSVIPLVPGTNQVATFDETDWNLEDDFRGSIQYDTTTKELVDITDIGTLPAGLTTLVPGAYDTWNGSAWVKDDTLHWDALRLERNGKLSNSDWTQLPDVQLTTQQITDWATHRQELRDLPVTYSDPDTNVWPTPPA